MSSTSTAGSRLPRPALAARSLRASGGESVIGRIGEVPRPAISTKVDGDDWTRTPAPRIRPATPADQARTARIARIKTALAAGTYEQDIEQKLSVAAGKMLPDIEG